ncbi:MAG: hypothetical protein GY760_07205 [Deltaproteobacteria bacterium]|nr:hypothetical protein [Deltaproteobacteria bacterium]
MKKSTRNTDIKIVAKVIELLKSTKELTRKQLRDCVNKKAEELKVDASYILEVLELKFDNMLKG